MSKVKQLCHGSRSHQELCCQSDTVGVFICAIPSQAIENNALSIEQVTYIIEGKRALGLPLRRTCADKGGYWQVVN